MELTPDHKESLKKVLSCFKKSGADMSTVSDIESTSTEVEFGITIKGKDIVVSIDFGNGDVYYEYFTSRNKIGNISDLGKLTDTIKKGIQDKPIVPNVDEILMMNRLKEALVKAIKESVLAEESSTGGGASFSVGQGEQYATPFAFKKKKKMEAIQKAGKLLVTKGFIKVPSNERFKAKGFDIEKWY